MCHLRHRLRIFLFDKRIMVHSRDIQVFVFLTIWCFTKSVMAWWVLVHEAQCFNIFWTTTHQTWSIDRHKQGQYFSEIIWAIQKTGAKFQALFNLATCSNYSRTNCVKFPKLHFFERVNKGELKMVNINS